MFCSKCWSEMTVLPPQKQTSGSALSSTVEDAEVQPGYEHPQALKITETAPKEKVDNVKELIELLRTKEIENVKSAPSPSRNVAPEEKPGISGVALPLEYAGFYERFKAYALDHLIVLFLSVLAALFIGFGLGPNFLFLLCNPLYFVYFIGTSGQTPGKALMRIKVISDDGKGALGYERAFLRWVGYIVSGAFFGIGWLLILVDEKHQGLHDKIARTVVVRVK